MGRVGQHVLGRQRRARDVVAEDVLELDRLGRRRNGLGVELGELGVLVEDVIQLALEQGQLGGGQAEAREVGDVFDVAATQRVRWNELASPDLLRAKAFYAKHFGFEFKETMPMGAMGDYCFIDHNGVRLGAVMQEPEPTPKAAWLFYFGVDSVAAARKAILAGGGTVLHGPHEVPGGEWIVVATDPQGARFGVVGPRGD